jgi:hypothetical protein
VRTHAPYQLTPPVRDPDPGPARGGGQGLALWDLSRQRGRDVSGAEDGRGARAGRRPLPRRRRVPPRVRGGVARASTGSAARTHCRWWPEARGGGGGAGAQGAAATSGAVCVRLGAHRAGVSAHRRCDAPYGTHRHTHAHTWFVHTALKARPVCSDVPVATTWDAACTHVVMTAATSTVKVCAVLCGSYGGGD